MASVFGGHRMSTKTPIRPTEPPTGTRGDQRHGAVPDDHPDRPGALELPTDEAVEDEGEARLDPEEDDDVPS
jgi:hypothetical protein